MKKNRFRRIKPLALAALLALAPAVSQAQVEVGPEIRGADIPQITILIGTKIAINGRIGSLEHSSAIKTRERRLPRLRS